MSSGVTGTGLDFLAIETDSMVYVYPITDTADQVENALRDILGTNFDKTTILIIPSTGATPTPTDYSKSCLLVPRQAGNIDLKKQFESVTRFTNGGLFADDAGQSLAVKIDDIPQLSYVGIHRSDNPYTVPTPTDNQTIGTGSFFSQQLWVNFNYNYTDDPTKYPTQSFVDSLVELNGKVNQQSNLLFQTGISVMDIAASGGGGVDKFVDLLDVNVSPVDAQLLYYNAPAGKFMQAPEVRVDSVTREVRLATSNQVYVGAINDVIVTSTGANVDVDAPNGLVDVDAASVQVTAASGPVSLFGNGITGDVTGNADRFVVWTGAQGANMTATTGNASIDAPVGVVDVNGSTVDIDATNAVTIDSTLSTITLNAPTGQILTQSGTSNVQLQAGANVVAIATDQVQLNGGNKIQLDSAAGECEINTVGLDVNSTGQVTINTTGGGNSITLNATNNIEAFCTGNLNLVSTGLNATLSSSSGTFATRMFNSGNGGCIIGTNSSNNGPIFIRSGNGLGTKPIEFASYADSLGATPSLTISPGITLGAAYDIFTNAAYTAPGPNSLINRSHLDAKLPDGVFGAATPQDPFGQALIWNGTQWKAGSAIQGNTNEAVTLISNGTGDVVITAASTGNIDMDTNDVASVINMNAGGIVVPVGGAADPTVKANNNTFATIYGQGSGVDLAVLTKDFLNNYLATRSIAEWDSHGNTVVTALSGVGVGVDLPFATPVPVYSVSENISAEWTNTNAPDPSVFVFTRPGVGGINVLFQFSFTVSVIGASTGINNDQIEFSLYVDQGAGFIRIPTSHFSATIAGNNDAAIVSSTGLARLNSGWKIQPAIRNNTGARDMLIESFKLSIVEQMTGIP